jgi:signal transduction histidine kinase
MAFVLVSLAVGLATQPVGVEALSLGVPATVGTLGFAIVGGLIASRTGNRVGWLFIGIAGVYGISWTASNIGDLALEQGLPGAAWWLWLGQWTFIPLLGLPIAVFYLFPTGFLPARAWRWPWRAYLAGIAVLALGFAFLPETVGPTEARLANPLGIDRLGESLSTAIAVAGIVVVLSAFFSFASLVARYRSGDQEERQQIRWLAAAGAAGGIVFVSLLVVGPLGESAARGEALWWASQLVLGLLVTIIVVGIPVATGIAILKYHLYDLNLVIRKTVIYAVLAGFVTLVYTAVVVGLSRIVGSDSLLLSIVATALIAGLFQPVRRWATRFANRLVFGRRAEPYEVLAGFSERVGETYAAEDVLPRMARVIAEGVGAERTEVWLGTGDDLHMVASWPIDSDAIDGTTHVVVARHAGESLGEIRLRKPAAEPITPTEEKLLDDLASQAGLVLANVGLTIDLQSRVDELAARAEELRRSRARIVEAHDAERRRLERNIHDGAQQHLVALAVKIRLARTFAATDPEKASAMLRTIADETETARATLLDLASGIYPAILEESGIAAALEEQAKAGDVPAAIDTDGVGRLPIETEAAVYFVCLEAMQNAAKYASATRIDVRLTLDSGGLSFEVTDDGVGFDASIADAGSGLSNMRDRLSAFGGDVQIESSRGRGTRVLGRIPVKEMVRP